jgi:hypothetical protein
MAYNPNRYAKFQTNDKVIIIGQDGEFKIIGNYLDLVNDVWMYRLDNISGWYPQHQLLYVE